MGGGAGDGWRENPIPSLISLRYHSHITARNVDFRSWHRDLPRFTYLKSYARAPWQNILGYLKLMPRESSMNKQTHLTLPALSWLSTIGRKHIPVWESFKVWANILTNGQHIMKLGSLRGKSFSCTINIPPGPGGNLYCNPREVQPGYTESINGTVTIL